MAKTFQAVCFYTEPPNWYGNVYLDTDPQGSYKAALEADQHIKQNPGHRTIVIEGFTDKGAPTVVSD